MAIRDTDKDWEIIASSNPFYGVLTEQRYRGKKSLDSDDLNSFYASGRRDVEFALGVLQDKLGKSKEYGSVLDFGSGVGRISRALSSFCSHVYGVDVSDSMLFTAREFASAENITYTKQLPDQVFSLIFSCIVFQHIPPRRGLSILDEIIKKTESGSAIAIQLPFFRDRRFLSATLSNFGSVSFDGDSVIPINQSDSQEGTMLMYDYPFASVYSIFVENGFRELFLHHTDHGGVHGAWIFSVRQ